MMGKRTMGKTEFKKLVLSLHGISRHDWERLKAAVDEQLERKVGNFKSGQDVEISDEALDRMLEYTLSPFGGWPEEKSAD